jgi:WD40 repeat protein
VTSNGSVFREHADLAGAHLRVWSGTGRIAGAGFLIGPDLVATAARCVAGRAGDGGARELPVWLDFPLLRDEHDAPVRVAAGIEPLTPGDVVLLRLRGAVPIDARVPPMRRLGQVDGSEFQVLGYPEGLVDGVWSAGTARAEADGRIRLDTASGEHPLDAGFAGAPVWHAAGGAVMGLAVVDERGARLEPVDRVLGVDPEALPCPYQGLRPFDEEHAEVFFGRDDEIDRLVDAVDRLPVVAVTGPSGAGKSSLVRAGLLPRLRAMGVEVVDLRITPGADAGPTLREALSERGTGRVVVADQFEELAASDPASARGLLESIVRLTRSHDDGPQARAVLTLRWSTLDELLTPELADVLSTARLVVAPMDRDRLREAIVRPARLPPGLVFEHGLVERILDDTGTEPGQLPLVESLLTELWERRDGGYLTMAAYTEAGGVAGAVAQHAERVVDGLEADPDALRGLFTALARVDRAERFTRRAVRLDALPAAQRALVPALVAGRLLVRTRSDTNSDTDTDREIVELAHQALIEHWPRLRTWLAEDRDFLVWRSELGTQRERWEDEGRDDAALPRGAALATATDWLATRADELPSADRAFLRRGIARQRRDVRRGRLVNAVLAVLVLAAATLGGTTAYSGNRIAAQLASANADTLGNESLARAAGDSVVATQLALAAWHSDPNSRPARTALARSYLAMRSVEAELPDVTPRPIQWLERGGDTALLDIGPGLVAVTGVTGPAPTARTPVDQVADPDGFVGFSPDGRRLADIGRDGRVRMHDLVGGGPPQTLPNTSAGAQDDVTSLQFSADGGRLAWLAKGDAGEQNVVIRDLRSGADVPHRLGPLPPGERFDLLLTADPDLVVLRYAPRFRTSTTRLVARSLADGSEVAEFPAGSELTGHGVVSCERSEHGGTGRWADVVVTPVRGGPPTGRYPVDTFDCSGVQISDGWLVDGSAGSGTDTGDVSLALTHLGTGERRRLTVPRELTPLGLAAWPLSPTDRMAVTSGTGGPAVLLAHGTSVLRLATEPAAPPPSNPSEIFLVGTTREHRVMKERGTVRVLERATDRELAALLLPAGVLAEVSSDEHLWVADPVGGGAFEVAWYELPTLRRVLGFRLPARSDAPPLEGRLHGGVSYVRDAVDGRERLLILSDGMLSSWDAATGQPLSTPVPVGATDAARAYRLESRLYDRPGHPGQVAVSTHDRPVELWDVPAGRRLATIPTELNPDLTRIGSDVLAFDPTGTELATLAAGRTIQVWDVDAAAPARPPIAAPQAQELVGFAADGYLVTLNQADNSSQESLAVVDVDTGQERGSLTPRLKFSRLTGDGRSAVLESTWGTERGEFPLAAQAWADELCTRLGRPFTPTEVGVLPAGTDTDPPCS